MKPERTPEARAARCAHVIRTAEWVLAQAYRAASAAEMRASQLRVREAVAREMLRRARR